MEGQMPATLCLNIGIGFKYMFKRVACLFGFHSYKHVAVNHYYDISFGEPGAKSTGVTSVCQSCNNIKNKSFYGVGWLSLDDLNKK